MNPHITQSLNEPQLAAVTAPPSNLLILAGAGSGKTRVLVHRIAYLIEHYGVSPHSILAVTFTNKAAHEMRGRIESLLNYSMGQMWVGTFHGLAHRMLRTHWQEAKLEETFQILDSDDQYRLIRRIMKQLEIDESKWPPKQAQWFINKQKEAGLRPQHVKNHDSSYFTETMLRIYQTYETVCQRSSLVDFAELLLRSLELLQQNPELQKHYRNRFQHILVDEFQDTNHIQYTWLKTLKSDNCYMLAVGDDDQSIYSWRGACIDNIHDFTKEMQDVTTIRLEQNYRSTQTILTAANALIENNSSRLGKKLWTDGNDGTKISLYPAFNERDEAYFIANRIQQWINQGGRAQDVAVLYRSNAQSRVLEEQLIDKHIPYRIYGGLKFYDRAEIKDATAYLRLLMNRSDDPAFERVVNTPTRGIGNSTLSMVRETARENELSMWQATEFLIQHDKLPKRATSSLANFIQLINAIATDVPSLNLSELVESTLTLSGLLAHYKKDMSEKGLSRVENLSELVNAASLFKPEDEKLPALAYFLAHVALEAGEEQSSSPQNCVNLMTLHAAKGLEFPLVFISGMEEELFPHKMSMDEKSGLEEERRLCYVGVTRAMEKLVLTYAECRRLHGMEKYCQPSRFIFEMPQDLIESERPRAKVSRPQSHFDEYFEDVPIDSDGPELRVGQRVKHQKFGPGTITNYEGQGDHTRLQVKFDKAGTKWLVASFAKLEAL